MILVKISKEMLFLGLDSLRGNFLHKGLLGGPTAYIFKTIFFFSNYLFRTAEVEDLKAAGILSCPPGNSSVLFQNNYPAVKEIWLEKEDFKRWLLSIGFMPADCLTLIRLS